MAGFSNPTARQKLIKISFPYDPHHKNTVVLAILLYQSNFRKMEALFLLIGISLIVAIAFLVGFLWAVKSKQYEDDFTPSVRMLFDSETKSRVNDNSSN